MMIGNLNEYDEEEPRERYFARFKHFMVSNDINDKKAKSLFLTLVGPKVYGLLEDLLRPKSIDVVQLDEMNTILTKHFTPKTSEIAARERFYDDEQNEMENVSDFIARLKSLAKNCNFRSFLSEAHRDKLVCGLKPSLRGARERLLTDSDLTYERMVEVATSMEVACQDALTLYHQRTDEFRFDAKKMSLERENSNNNLEEKCY